MPVRAITKNDLETVSGKYQLTAPASGGAVIKEGEIEFILMSLWGCIANAQSLQKYTEAMGEEALNYAHLTAIPQSYDLDGNFAYDVPPDIALFAKGSQWLSGPLFKAHVTAPMYR